MESERTDADGKPPTDEKIFRVALMAMDEGAVLLDGEGKVLAVNPAAGNMLGIGAGELIGLSSDDFAQAVEFVNEDDTPFHWQVHPAILARQTGQAQRDVRVGVRHPCGAVGWISLGARPLTSDGRSPPYAVLTTLRDITERVRSDLMLERSEHKYRALAEGMPMNLIRYDRLARPLYFNPAMLASISSQKLPVLGQSFVEAHPGDPGIAAQQRIIEDVIATGTPATVEVRVPNIEGEIRLHRVHYVAERDGKGEIVGTLAFGHDITESRRAEEALRVSEQEFRTLAENLPDALVRYDRNGRLTYANSRSENDFSIADDQAPGKALQAANSADRPLDNFRRALKHTLSTGERSKFEIKMASGHTYLCFIVAERAADGRISGAIAVSRDITELKRMENKIRRREREFRTLVENSPDPIIRYDRDCRRLFAHTGNLRRKSRRVESLNGATPNDGRILAGDEAKVLMAGIRQVFESGTPISVDVDLVDDYGIRRDHQVLLVPELDEKGEVATVLTLGRDITAIRDAERQMTQFVANLPGFAFTYQLSPDGHGSFPFVSPGIEKLFGLKPEALKHDIAPLLAVAHPDDLPRTMATMDESVRTMAPFRVEIRAARPGMAMRWGELRAVPVRQADGSVLWHGIMLDIDRRKRYEAELVQHRHHLEKLVEERTLALSAAKESAEAATRAKSHFLAAASHDLRQPLQAIRLFNDVLAMSGLNEQQHRISESLSKAVSSLSELFNDLLDLSRLDAGTIEPRPTLIQAEDLIAMVGTEFDAIFHEKKLRLHLFWPRQNLVLFSDSTLLQNMVRNLVSNAVKYTLRGGVLVAIRRRGDHALIQVWDTGIGIAEEKLESVFEEYFQIGNPERDRAKGVGLGLAIVKRLGRLLGIEVRLRSREGQGSVFELHVPLARTSDMQALPKQPQENHANATPGGLSGTRIVVIEDDVTAGEAIRLALEAKGIRVTLFTTAEDALASAEIQEADFYISDYRLPGMNGLQLLDTLQRNSADPIKAVVLTGNTSPDQIAHMRSSRWPVLIKPIGIPQLLSALDAYETGH
jgi:PAS domain S-box-containing protein